MGTERRLKLFIRQSEGLGRFIHGIDEPVLLCPLCLRLWGTDYVAGDKYLRLEDAPPKQYSDHAVRCLTCSECNHGAGITFESTASAIRTERQAAIDMVTGVNTPLPGGNVIVNKRILLSADAARRLATVQPSERLLELKSAFVIAFAVLGHRYAMGSGLNLVREHLRSGATAPVPMACFRARDLASDRLLVATSPIGCIMVPHPTNHLLDPEGHMVVLPLPASTSGFYEAALPLLAGRQSWEFVEQHPVSPAYRPSFTWDQLDPRRLGTNDSFSLDHDCECGETHNVATIDLRLGVPASAHAATTPNAYTPREDSAHLGSGELRAAATL